MMDKLLQLIRNELVESVTFENDLDMWIICIRDSGSFNVKPDELEYALSNLNEFI